MTRGARRDDRVASLLEKHNKFQKSREDDVLFPIPRRRIVADRRHADVTTDAQTVELQHPGQEHFLSRVKEHFCFIALVVQAVKHLLIGPWRTNQEKNYIMG